MTKPRLVTVAVALAVVVVVGWTFVELVSRTPGPIAQSTEPVARGADPAMHSNAGSILGGFVSDAIQREVQQRFPGYRVWRASRHQQTGVLDVTLFDPSGPSVHGFTRDETDVRQIPQYTIRFQGDGTVEFEEQHPVSAKAIPDAVEREFSRWQSERSKPLTVQWLVGQERDGERLFAARCDFSSLEGTTLWFSTEGRLVSETEGGPAPR